MSENLLLDSSIRLADIFVVTYNCFVLSNMKWLSKKNPLLKSALCDITKGQRGKTAHTKDA